MPNDHLVLCGGTRISSRNTKQPSDGKTHRLKLGKSRNQLHLKLEHISESMAANLSQQAVDLIEIASYVYCADQMATRGGTKEFEYGEHWRRNFTFSIAVRRPDFWNQKDVRTKLEEVLGFLSDDDYEFRFSKLHDPPSVQKYLEDPVEDESDFEDVMLFSGGLDSFGGAVQEIVAGQRKIVLVSHRPANKLYARQKSLVGDLNERLLETRKRPLHVAVEINKGKSLARDSTQRSRSFLFASLAAIVAQALRLSRIRFYENGVISLNLPISPQVVGARATRTTHPRVLKGFAELFSMIFEKEFVVENPFLWKTKAEVLQLIKAAGCGDLCKNTISCVHTWQSSIMYSHCAQCSQCIDRYISALAAGFDETEEPPEMYESNVVLGERQGPELTLVERYVGVANEIENLPDEAAFLERFGEAARVLNYVNLGAERALKSIFDLYRRHAKGVLHALTQLVERHAEKVVLKDYPAQSLLSIAVGRQGNMTSGRNPQRASARTTFRVDRKTFTVNYKGKICRDLTPVEFDLTERLAKTLGRYHSLDTLREDVWNERDKLTSTATIQKTVSNARKKLRHAGLTGFNFDGRSRPGHYALILE